MLVLLRSMNTVLVVMLFMMGLGTLVKSYAVLVLLVVNPAGKDVVFNKDPSEEYTFMTALIS